MIFMQYREFQKNHKKYLQKSVDKSKFFGWLLEDIFCKPSKQKQGYLYIMEKLHLWVWFLTRKAVKNEKSSVDIIDNTIKLRKGDEQNVEISQKHLTKQWWSILQRDTAKLTAHKTALESMSLCSSG